MQITQTVQVPDSHKLTIDIPPEIPPGRFTLKLDFTAEETPEEKEARKAKAMAAIKHCKGLAKRLGIDLSSDRFLELRREDRDFENRLDAIHNEESMRWSKQ